MPDRDRGTQTSCCSSTRVAASAVPTRTTPAWRRPNCCCAGSPTQRRGPAARSTSPYAASLPTSGRRLTGRPSIPAPWGPPRPPWRTSPAATPGSRPTTGPHSPRPAGSWSTTAQRRPAGPVRRWSCSPMASTSCRARDTAAERQQYGETKPIPGADTVPINSDDAAARSSPRPDAGHLPLGRGRRPAAQRRHPPHRPRAVRRRRRRSEPAEQHRRGHAGHVRQQRALRHLPRCHRRP